MPPGDTVADDWVRSVLGVDPNAGAKPPSLAEPPPQSIGGGNGRSPSGKVAGAAPKPNPVLGQAAADPKVWTQSVGPALSRQGPYKTGARIQAPVPTGPATECKGANGKTVSIVTGKDGRVALTRDPAPITEVTFSGGGGKGAALPGAIRALSESGALKNVKAVHGASVGSMTAAMVAAGITPEAFQDLSDNTNFGALVKGGDKLMVNVDGDGLEDLVRKSMGTAVGAQIAKFANKAMRDGTKVDKATLKTLDEMTDKFSKGAGPTFMDLRILSKIIPDIKEVTISGTMIGKADKPKPDRPPGEIKKTKPEMVIFSADTQPDMEVARAVHASAALPPVFKPVDIPLKSGEIGRFEDGGVLNNAPTSDSIGTDPGLDPVPETGKMTFVFEEDAAADVLQGKASPTRSRVNDLVAGAENSAADYAKNRGLADRPEDVVMVPLKFDRPKPPAKGLLDRIMAAPGDMVDSVKKAVTHPLEFALTDKDKADYSGFVMGTVNFDIPKDDKMKLQGMTEDATKAHLDKRQQKETRSFASVDQMFYCTTRDDLAAMDKGGYKGAKEALKFRDEVVKQVKALEALAASKPSDPKVQTLLAAINGLAKGNQERIAFIGRELNRSGKLADLLAASKKGGVKLDAVAAGCAVADVLAARKTARKILTETVYPKMVREDAKGVAGTLLSQMDTMLRDAQSAQDINRALRLGIDYFSRKFDPGGVLGHKDFARALTKQLQPET